MDLAQPPEKECVLAAKVAIGLSIEDATGDPSSPLYQLPLAVERVRAAREAINQSRADVVQFSQSLQECIVFNRLELALSEKQMPRFVGNVSS